MEQAKHRILDHESVDFTIHAVFQVAANDGTVRNVCEVGQNVRTGATTQSDLLAGRERDVIAGGKLIVSRAAHEAQGHLKRGLQLNPKIERAYVYLGHIYKAMDNKLAAEAMFEKTLTLNPDNIDAQRELKLLNSSRGSAGPRRRR